MLAGAGIKTHAGRLIQLSFFGQILFKFLYFSPATVVVFVVVFSVFQFGSDSLSDLSSVGGAEAEAEAGAGETRPHFRQAAPANKTEGPTD